MTINAGFNHLHIQLLNNHWVGPTSKIGRFTVEDLTACCSYTNNSFTSRIWNRFILLIKNGEWASDKAISKHIYLSVVYVRSKIADAILKNESVQEKKELKELINKVSSVLDKCLDYSDNTVPNFLDNTGFRSESHRGLRRKLNVLTYCVNSSDPEKTLIDHTFSKFQMYDSIVPFYGITPQKMTKGFYYIPLFDKEIEMDCGNALEPTVPDFMHLHLNILFKRRYRLNPETGDLVLDGA